MPDKLVRFWTAIAIPLLAHEIVKIIENVPRIQMSWELFSYYYQKSTRPNTRAFINNCSFRQELYSSVPKKYIGPHVRLLYEKRTKYIHLIILLSCIIFCIRPNQSIILLLLLSSN